MKLDPWKLSLKAYEADTPEERLAAFTELYEHYGIEMLPEEKEIVLKDKNYRSED
ncbi:hypothetical protein [Anaerovibrio lipolyticus]|uniref:hypothetical protein n=1 Tax=Anaerovibrio lipolyticus TaxID=82374 RepID=UPI0012DC2042|nr:hypothetical protein [Anaerovibrio lipolyticus]